MKTTAGLKQLSRPRHRREQANRGRREWLNRIAWACACTLQSLVVAVVFLTSSGLAQEGTSPVTTPVTTPAADAPSEGAVAAPSSERTGEAGTAGTQPSQPTASTAEESWQTWIASLESDEYHLRERATRELIEGGETSIGPLVRAIEQGGPETVVRGIQVLSHHARSEDAALAEAATLALSQLEKLEGHPGSRYAQQAVKSLVEFRRDRAIVRLEKLGMRRALATNLGAEPLIETQYVLEIDETWTGTLSDLRELRYITNIPNLSLHGPQVTNEWLAALADVSHVRRLKLHHVSVTADGLRHLASWDQLNILILMYTPFDATALEPIATLKGLGKLSLFGTRIRAEEVQALQKSKGIELDYRAGAFLGVRFLNPGMAIQVGPGCRVESVHPGGPAELGGLKGQDLIVRVDETEVVDEKQLIGYIGTKSPGDRIQVMVYRVPYDLRTEPIRLEITMGEWP